MHQREGPRIADGDGVEHRIARAAHRVHAAIGIPHPVAVDILERFVVVAGAVVIDIGELFRTMDVGIVAVGAPVERHLGARDDPVHRFPDLVVDRQALGFGSFERRIPRGFLRRAVEHRGGIEIVADVEHAEQDRHQRRRDQRELDDGDAALVACKRQGKKGRSHRVTRNSPMRLAMVAKALLSSSVSAATK